MALLALLFASALPSVCAAREREPKLANDEAIVLCRGTSATVRTVEYWRVGTKRGFDLSMRGVLTPQVVKAGRYYLHTYSTIYRNVFAPRLILYNHKSIILEYSNPSSPSRLFEFNFC